MSGLTQPTEQAPRLRLAKHIDLQRADANCDRCKGTGIVRTETIEEQGGILEVPVICRCVSRSGGVAQDAFDRMVTEMHEQVQNGTFAENLASDIMRLPQRDRDNAVKQILKQVSAAVELGDQAVEKQLRSAVARVSLLRAKEQ